MNLKKVFVLIGKFVLLSVLYFILFSIGGMLFPVHLDRPFQSDPSQLFLGITLLVVVRVAVVCLVVLRSRWTGWKLMLATAFAFYGVETVMSQIETWWFGPALGIPSSLLPDLFLANLVVAVTFAPLAVLILGKARKGDGTDLFSDRLVMPAGEWAWKLTVIAVGYLVLYFGFGFIVAWQNPNLVAMYGGGQNSEVFNNATLIPFQVLRSTLWVLFALPLIRMNKGGLWETALLVGVFYALPMNMGHAVPNPFMPDPSVRLSHFIETTTSNFLFGLVVTHLLLWRPKRSAEGEA